MRKTKNLLVALLLTTPALAQNESPDKVVVTGSVESNMLVPQEDDAIGTGEYDDWLLSNTYVDFVASTWTSPCRAMKKTSKVQDFPISG